MIYQNQLNPNVLNPNQLNPNQLSPNQLNQNDRLEINQNMYNQYNIYQGFYPGMEFPMQQIQQINNQNMNNPEFYQNFYYIQSPYQLQLFPSHESNYNLNC